MCSTHFGFVLRQSIFATLIAILLATNLLAQNCYQRDYPMSGLEKLFNDNLEQQACITKDSLFNIFADAVESSGTQNPMSDNTDFEIIGMEVTPVMAYADPAVGIIPSYDTYISELEGKEKYIAIIKEFVEFKDDLGYYQSQKSVKFTVKFKLPELKAFTDKGTITFIELANDLNNTARLAWDDSGSFVATEVEVLQSFIQKLRAILDGSYEMSTEAISDFTEIPLDDVFVKVSAGNPNRSSPNNVVNLANIELGSASEWEVLSDMQQQMISITIHDIPYTIGYLNTSNNDQINQVVSDVQSVKQTYSPNTDFFIWTDIVVPENNENYSEYKYRVAYYYEYGASDLWDSETIIDKEFTEVMQNWGVYPTVEPNPQLRMSSNGDWKWGNNYLDNINEDDPEKFAKAIGCGAIDGLLGSLEAIYNMSKGVLEAGEGFVKKTVDYHLELLELAIKEKSLWAVYDQITNDGINAFNTIKKKAIESWKLIKDTYNGIVNNFKTIIDAFYCAITDFYDGLINGTKDAGYTLGQLCFELGFTVFTAGTGSGLSGAKYFAKFMQALKSVEINGTQALVKIMGEMFDKAKTAATNSAQVAKKYFKCKILGQGCFIKDTPVLMANNNYNISFGNTAKAMAVAASMPIVAVPIQDVQLLDYAVAHETINATYGMTASTDDDIYLGLMDKDPYTSDQQRERDEYQLDDENWNEVVFEEVRGGSTAKLALHNDWIEKQSYEIDAVVNLDLPEQGISGPFRITSIKHIIPQKKPVDDDEADEYDYRPVTALFTHESNQVFNISFDNGEKLGVTYQHPIYSTTAGDWKLAGELEIGEEVLTKSGNTKVVSSTKKEGSETVYNLEVKELHNFLVGESGIVVHNKCLKAFMDFLFGKLTKKKVPNKQWVDYAEESGLTTKTFELDQLEKLGQASPGGGKRMLSLDKTKDGRDMPGIDAFDEDGTAVTLKRVLEPNESTLETKLRQMGKKATEANASADFDGTLKDITGMISTEHFTIDQIKAKIHKLRGTPNNPGGTSSSQGIIKKYFIDGSDGSVFYEY